MSYTGFLRELSFPHERTNSQDFILQISADYNK